MPDRETRRPCPVCLGVMMEKARVATSHGAASRLTLDHCGRCGGVWFDAGEVQDLRHFGSGDLARAVGSYPLRAAHDAARDTRRTAPAARMACRRCEALVGRDQRSCAACGWTVHLDCPTCDRPMETVAQHGVTLDVCRSCKGAWFDRTELAAIWELASTARLVTRERSAVRSPADRSAAGDAAWIMLDVLSYSPGLAVAGVRIVGSAAAATGDTIGGVAAVAGEGITSAPGALGGVVGGAVEVVGETSGAAFEGIAGFFGALGEILGGLLD